ncbi:carbamoyltransferase HypF [Megasphaera paucivorans]|uniref:Carbamoyltransferase n=1 Tax=Megasphaera paucivorans TaxID=349095 RepID=A0A1H0AZM7_9FIRM|nr:carbamoyltransferase HypF [Megasphaera paucivorans]SDN38829.1 Hydrogenase maturation protein, carbamoyltransferase HypF [Megasphaera paucivorans]
MIRVFGIVQGVGFRPFVSRTAAANHIRGCVCNKGSYVEIMAQGEKKALQSFYDELQHNPPPRAAILKIDREKAEGVKTYSSFDIIESTKEKGDIFVSPDIGICDACKKELFDKKNRRYLHPFINCTACGPRLTILDAMPYDRERTSMGEFPMCADCTYEYTHPETRRYDAQPVCCKKCGPEVYLMDRHERGSSAITEARRVISNGGIIAIKGIGGFHLSCDATNEAAVCRLRRLKKRPIKPFAVMIKNLDVVRTECDIHADQEAVLTGHQKPIVLLDKKTGGKICQQIAPGNPKIGVMLPYAPLQLLLFTYDDEMSMPDILVMTSANESGAPICRTDIDVRREVVHMCDLVISHNRKIRLSVDDSVMDFYDGKPYMIRRSRGYAPLPFILSRQYKGQVLGIGGELKNTFCLGKNNLFYPSPYVGDMTDVRTMKALRESIVRMETLLEVKPSIVACDMHPRYNTTIIAGELGLPVFSVQHHYAHILSCMAENKYSEPVIGVAFDGTGFGTDGTIWGGEILTADYTGFTRRGAIEPFMQRGGDIAVKEGWRIAISMLYSMFGNSEIFEKSIRQLALCDENNLMAQCFMADNHINSIRSTSAGRLFDAVSAILGICRSSTFEGEASMTLQFAAERWKRKHKEPELLHRYDLKLQNGIFYLPTNELVRHMAEGILARWPTGCLAYIFHRILADMIIKACKKVRADTGIATVALSGGVFQNRLLLRMCDKGLQDYEFRVLKHSLLPPNDGGISLGQAVAAMQYIQNR